MRRSKNNVKWYARDVWGLMIIILGVLITLSFVFISFESSSMFLPFNFFLLLVFSNFFLRRVLKTNKYIFKRVVYHFFNKLFPGVWNLVIFFLLVIFFNTFGLFPRSFSITSLPVLTLRIRLILWGRGYIICLINNFKACVGHFLPQRSPISGIVS